MVPLNRILGLAAAGVLVAVSASSPARAEKLTPNMVRHADVTPHAMSECSLYRRALSRHVCHADLLRDEPIDSAENN